MSTTQQRNAEQVELLRADFQARREPNFAWKSCVSAGLALPALRALWPMSSVDYAAATQARDVSGGAYHLTNNNSVSFRHDNLVSMADFGGANQYLSRADGGAVNWADITGTEAWIPAAQRGMYMGGWFRFDGTGAINNVMGKWSVGNESYYLQRTAGDVMQFGIHDGVAPDVISSSVTIAQDTWYCVVGRFDPSTSVDIFVNGTWDTNGVGITAAIQDGAAAFTIGVLATLANYMDGKASLCFLGACDVSDAIVECFYNQTRTMFGV